MSAIDDALEAAQQQRPRERAKEERGRRFAARRDPRPHIRAPGADAAWLPEMDVLNDVIGKVAAARPPTRDIDGVIDASTQTSGPEHARFYAGASQHEEDAMTKLPPPEQWVLARMNEMECAEMIERHIDYVGQGRHGPCTCRCSSCSHYLQRHDGALPTVVAIATLPIVLADGGLLAPDGLDRDRGIIFIIPKELRAIIPAPQRLHASSRAAGDAVPVRRVAVSTSPPTTPASAP